MVEFCCWFSFFSSSGESLRCGTCSVCNEIVRGLSLSVFQGRQCMTLSAFLAVIILLAIGFVILYVMSIYLKYRKSSYKDASGNSFLQILFDKGNYGEFLIFSRLEKLEKHHRLLRIKKLSNMEVTHEVKC